VSGYLDRLKSNIGRSVIVAALVVPAGAAWAQANPSSQQIIDALKATVPIWKRETWEGGSDWALCSHPVDQVSQSDQVSRSDEVDEVAHS